MCWWTRHEKVWHLLHSKVAKVTTTVLSLFFFNAHQLHYCGQQIFNILVISLLALFVCLFVFCIGGRQMSSKADLIGTQILYYLYKQSRISWKLGQVAAKTRLQMLLLGDSESRQKKVQLIKKNDEKQNRQKRDSVIIFAVKRRGEGPGSDR